MLHKRKTCLHSPGTTVEAKASGWKKFYKGKVTAFDDIQGTYTVEFEDGDVKNNIKSFNIKSLNTIKKTFTAPDGVVFDNRIEYRNYVSQFYSFADKCEETLVKTPGQINGQSFNLKNLKGCNVQLLDFSEQVLVDGVESCKILIGPSCGSVFIRNANNCEIYVACKQFRCRDCSDCTISLYSKTEPIVETSSKMKFYPYKALYPGQTLHFAKALLDPNLSHWANVFDFNKGDPKYEEPHWELIPKENGWPEWSVSLSDETFKDALPENPVSEDTRAAPVMREAGFSFGLDVSMQQAQQAMKTLEIKAKEIKNKKAFEIPNMTEPLSIFSDTTSEPQVDSDSTKIQDKSEKHKFAVIIVGDTEAAKEAAKSVTIKDPSSNVYVSERVKQLLENEEQKPDQLRKDKILSLSEKSDSMAISKLVICSDIKREEGKSAPIWSEEGKVAIGNIISLLQIYVPLLIKQDLVQSEILLLGNGLDYIKSQLNSDLEKFCTNVTLVKKS